jgi:virulence-associated protein VagC
MDFGFLAERRTNLAFPLPWSYTLSMKTATVIREGETQTVHLPRGYHLPTPTVQVRQEGDAIVLEPMKPRVWPAGFFDEIHMTDPAFVRPDRGTLGRMR